MLWLLFILFGTCTTLYAPPIQVISSTSGENNFGGETPQQENLRSEGGQPVEGKRVFTESPHPEKLSSEETPGTHKFSSFVQLPKNSRVFIQDGRLQYTHGFSDNESRTSVSEQGKLFSTNDGWEYVIIKNGEYSYVSPEGLPVRVKYVADHNGFRIVN